jgi:hypothetical protein
MTNAVCCDVSAPIISGAIPYRSAFTDGFVHCNVRGYVNAAALKVRPYGHDEVTRLWNGDDGQGE